MKEHRLIEKMIAVIRAALERGRRQGEVDARLVEAAIDFIRVYADRTHHGKEEDILFRELGRKTLAPEHARLMEELIEDHRRGRRLVNRLADDLRRYQAGDLPSREAVASDLTELADFYPQHIEKEDRTFFPQTIKYFDAAENEAILGEMSEFDARMIHEKYARMVEEAGG